MNNRGFVQVLLLIGAVILISVGGYFATTEEAQTPEVEAIVATQNDNVPVEERDISSPPPTRKTPPPTQVFESAVRDVKYFFDTAVLPKEGEVQAGYTNDVRIRGRLVAIKPEGLCEWPPCSASSSADYRYVIENAQDYIQNSKYRISIRKTGDPVARSLKEGEVYTFSGILEHSFNDAEKVQFVFDPRAATRD